MTKKPTSTKRKEPAPMLRTVGAAPETPATTSGADDRVERLSIPLTADSSAIDWERMRPGTRDKLKALTGAAVGGVVASEAIDPSVVGMLYGSLGMLMVSAARAKGYTAEQASVLIFTEQEKAALVDPTSKVLSKYSGALGKWQDEIMLSVTLGTVLTAKLSALRKTAPVISMAPKTEPQPEDMGDVS